MAIATMHPRPQPPVDRLVTAAEFAEHPEWGPCELIRGKVVTMTNPKPDHGFLAFAIGKLIDRYAEPRGLGRVFVGDSGIFIERDPDTIRGPDVGFVRQERLPSKRALKEYFTAPPDLCVEIVSPTDRWSEISEKVDMFLSIGVALVWVIDPQTRKAHAYRKGREVRVVDAKGSLDGEDVLPGFAPPLADVFSVLE